MTDFDSSPRAVRVVVGTRQEYLEAYRKDVETLRVALMLNEVARTVGVAPGLNF